MIISLESPLPILGSPCSVMIFADSLLYYPLKKIIVRATIRAWNGKEKAGQAENFLTLHKRRK